MLDFEIPQNLRLSQYNKVLDLIYQQTNELRVGKKENGESFSTFSVSVPRPVLFVLLDIEA